MIWEGLGVRHYIMLVPAAISITDLCFPNYVHSTNLCSQTLDVIVFLHLFFSHFYSLRLSLFSHLPLSVFRLCLNIQYIPFFSLDFCAVSFIPPSYGEHCMQFSSFPLFSTRVVFYRVCALYMWLPSTRDRVWFFVSFLGVKRNIFLATIYSKMKNWQKSVCINWYYFCFTI